MLVVVGGHTRNIGKTTLTVQVAAAFPQMNWLAMKITQYGHGVCSANGEPCDCVTADHSLAVSEERDATSGTDTSRMLAAGARRVLWVRTQQGQLSEAMPRVRKEMSSADNALVESNSILRFLRPDLYVAVLDPASDDVKPSCVRYLDRADAVFVPAGKSLAGWAGVPAALLRGKPVLPLLPDRLADESLAWLRSRIVPGA